MCNPASDLRVRPSNLVGLAGDIRHSPLTVTCWPLCRVSRNTISVVGKSD